MLMLVNLLKHLRCMSELINGTKLIKLFQDIFLNLSTPCYMYKKQENLKMKEITKMQKECISPLMSQILQLTFIEKQNSTII